MKLISWNVNGIRSALKKGFLEYLGREQPDILCLQETRAWPEQVALTPPTGYQIFWARSMRKGYAGTAVFTRINPIDVREGMNIPKHDQEGRLLTLEFNDFYLTNIYVPNAGRDLARLDYRVNQWDPDLLQWLQNLAKKKPLVFCGDLNVAHKEIDLANPRGNKNNSGFTPQERAGFDNLLQAGFVDSFRQFTPEGGHYTWWSNIGRAREKNIGWRIDYFCISSQLGPRLISSGIQPHIKGSDHCPVFLELA